MAVTKPDTLLIIAPRSNNVRDASGNHVLAPVTIAKQKQKKLTNKYERSAMTAPQNKELKIGSPTSQMSRMMSKSSSCNGYWEEETDWIFKVLEPDGLGKSYSL